MSMGLKTCAVSMMFLSLLLIPACATIPTSLPANVQEKGFLSLPQKLDTAHRLIREAMRKQGFEPGQQAPYFADGTRRASGIYTERVEVSLESKAPGQPPTDAHIIVFSSSVERAREVLAGFREELSRLAHDPSRR